MKLRHILIFFIGSLVFSNSYAQSAVLQLDKSFYVTGEIVWYKLYLPNTEANKSAIVNAIVSDKDGEIIEQFYLQANENAAIEGYYKIPFNIDSDYYRLSILGTVATSPTLASVVFPIYNDLEAIPADALLETVNTTIPKPQVENKDKFSVSLKLDKKSDTPQIDVTIKNKDAEPIIAWYKLNLPAPSTMENAAVRIAISDCQNNIISETPLLIGPEGTANATYEVPLESISTKYCLAILAMDESKTLLANTNIAVENTPAIKVETKTNSLNPEAVLEDLVVDIQLDKTQYNPRQAVRANLSVKDKNGQALEANISVTVNDASLITSDLVVKNATSGTIGNNINVRGTLMDTAGTPVRASVLGMYSSLEDRIFYCSADEAGQFNMQPPLFYGKRPVQFIGYQFEHDDISIGLQERQMPPIEATLVYPQAIQDYLRLSQQRKKIFQIYTTLESQLETEKIKYDIQDLEPAFSYIVDEYESFESMRDFFGELITPLKFLLQEDSTYRAELYNPSGLYDANTVLSGDPLFIIDGKLTRDADFVANMDMDYIETIALMYKPENLRKKFKAIGRSGVVKMTTNLRDVQIAEKDNEDVFTINGLQAKADFPVFQPNELDARQPFFRPQLYWNPNIEADKNGQANFTFYQSDDISDFTIRVVVKAKNGKFGTATKTYSVRANQ